MSWESLAPLVIIGAALCAAGGSQHLIQKMIYGKPKHPRADAWDKAMEYRDQRLQEDAAKATH